jgi:hypothetical protein
VQVDPVETGHRSILEFSLQQSNETTDRTRLGTPTAE